MDGTLCSRAKAYGLGESGRNHGFWLMLNMSLPPKRIGWGFSLKRLAKGELRQRLGFVIWHINMQHLIFQERPAAIGWISGSKKGIFTEKWLKFPKKDKKYARLDKTLHKPHLQSISHHKSSVDGGLQVTRRDLLRRLFGFMPC